MFQRPTYTTAWSQKVREQKSSKFGRGFFSWIYNAYCACANFLWGFPYELSEKAEMAKDEGIDLSVILLNQAPSVLNTPGVLMISPDVLMISLWCTEHPPSVLMITPTCILVSPVYS